MDDVGRAINVSQYYVHEGNVTATPPRASERTPVSATSPSATSTSFGVERPWATSRRHP